MFCPNCRNEMDDQTDFCPKCGYDLVRGSRPSRACSKEKNVGVGIVLAFVIVGTGYMYAEKIGKGLCIFAGGIIISAFAALFLSESTAPIIGVLLMVAYVAIWIWSIYDTRNTIRRYNDELIRTGDPPW